MKRIDKVISEQTSYTRKEIKEKIKKHQILVNEEVVLKPETKVKEEDIITVDNKVLKRQKNVYLILNKPKGYISSTEDKNNHTVLELIKKEYLHRNLFPAGRLDKDTTGLMIITDDGEFAHNILAPKKHIKKLYNVTIDIPVTEEMVAGFKNGIMLNDGECKSATLQVTGTNTGLVTLTEGRYHQIKRMFGCYGAKVVELHRIGMGNFTLPDDLKIGECREFTEEELRKVIE